MSTPYHPQKKHNKNLAPKNGFIYNPPQPTKRATKSTKTQAGNEATCPGLSNLIAIFSKELLIGLSSLPMTDPWEWMVWDGEMLLNPG